MERKEKEVRHSLMQHIIESRNRIFNTNSMHYRYLEDKKRMGKLLTESNPREELANAMRLKEKEEV